MRYIYTLLLSMSLFFGSAQSDFHLQYHSGLGFTAFSQDNFKVFGATLPDQLNFAHPTVFVGFKMGVEELESSLYLHRLFVSSDNDFGIDLQQVQMLLSYKIGINERWKWIPGLGWQILGGIIESRDFDASTGASVASVARWYAIQHDLLINSEFCCKVNGEIPVLPTELFVNLQAGVPLVGSINSALRPDEPLIESALIPLSIGLQFGFRYQLIGRCN